MKFIKICIPIMTTALLLCSCVGSKMPERETIPQASTAQENTQTDESYDTTGLPSVNNDNINAFIAKYNQNQTDESLRVADGYNINYDEQKGVYYVVSNKANLTLRLNEDGNVVSAALTDTDDITKQLAVSNVIIDMLWSDDFIPEEQQKQMEEIRKQAEMMQQIITEKTEEFEKNKTELNTELLEATLPMN